MSGVKRRVRILAAAAASAWAAFALAAMEHPMPGLGPGVNGARYATDAYPGFDDTDEITKPERKEPRWFRFLTGPGRDSAAEQFSYCVGLLQKGDFSTARRQLDALVREWPTSPEAPKAQLALAEICLDPLHDTEDAFKEHRYLLDFYSLQCDYEKVADRLYEIAGRLKEEGKEILFVRFANTVDVRRAYETCVLRAPGAKWVPAAMLTIGSLREDEGKYDEAVKVYENLRNLHPGTEEALSAIARESAVRMILLRNHEYNRSRCLDTRDFLKMARGTCRAEDAEAIEADLREAETLLEREAYLGATFYDSPTRTKRSAINAYERFLADYPTGARADAARARLKELKGDEEGK